MFFHHGHTYRVKFIQWAFLDLLVLFVAVSMVRPSAGLAGIGSVLILGSLNVLANKDYIYEQYKNSYRKPKSQLLAKLVQSSELYRNINVYAVWPMIFILGLIAIYASLYVG